MTWHADKQLLVAYANGALDDAVGWSVEQHVSDCAACRATVAEVALRDMSLDDRLDAVWAEITYEIDALERRTPVERVLLAFGVPDHLARLLAATPSLTVSWLLAVTFALASAVFVARSIYEPGAAAGGSSLVFLVLAPLLPVAGVAGSFGPHVCPTYDVEVAAPVHAGRLLLIRSVAVLATTLPMAAVSALALPEMRWTVAAWVLPSLALASTSLALASYTSPLRACTVVGGLWIAAVVGVEAAATSPLVAFGPVTQLIMLLATAATAAVVAHRLDQYNMKVWP